MKWSSSTPVSIESAGESLALTDENTHSNISERNLPRSPVAMGATRNVLAVYDLTFMIPPYNAVRDNDQLVTNIAEFLTEEQKDYRLADFPGSSRAALIYCWAVRTSSTWGPT